jgi:crotonobetainyl-CoA:carnitine CoA-transferase CaiB-like acyl-CoA transferase
MDRPVTAPLDDLQVIDRTTGIAGPYCTKLFADAGADVVKIEPVGGDPLLDHAVVGHHVVPGAGYRFASVDRWLNRPAPTLGAHHRDPSRTPRPK